MSNELTIDIQRLPNARGLPLPSKATDFSAGVDLLAAIDGTQQIDPGQRLAVPTGIAISIPIDFEAQVRPRSGLAMKHGITVLNSPGTIDADYRGEISILLINLGENVFEVERGMRVAQLVVAPVFTVKWREVAALDETQRSVSGFGSTGLT
jgi:dUTP pyrophosphatase